ncbi:hypothetical protein J6590_061196 [Homalodisca vitripennis]|nr:hypothetical protein J6590_061196 [Homalodisca vitripennis]
MILTDTFSVLQCLYLDQICPISMRYIVLLKALPVSRVEVWYAVINWARCKVLNDHMIIREDQLQPYINPRLVIPRLKHLELCMLNVIQMVEEDLEGSSSCLPNYHCLPDNSSGRLLMCTDNYVDDQGQSHITHEMLEVCVIQDCSSWVNAVLRTSSELTISITDTPVELYSIVCTALMEHSGEMVDVVVRRQTRKDQFTYQCNCFVRTVLVTSAEVKEVKSEINFKNDILFYEEFEIPLSLRLEPNSTYIIEIEFLIPHPLWYASDINPCENQTSGFGVVCGLVNKNNNWYGSHIKYIIYKTVSV